MVFGLEAFWQSILCLGRAQVHQYIAMDSKKKETKDKEKKSKSGDKAVKDKKEKKEKSSSKDSEKVIKVMQKEFESWLDSGDETANIGMNLWVIEPCFLGVSF